MAKNITETFRKVKHLLETDKKYRDSDDLLVARFWWDELRVMKVNGKEAPILDFFMLYQEGKMTPAETIERSRRRVNQLHPDTIGLSYKRRAQKEKDIKKELHNVQWKKNQ